MSYQVKLDKPSGGHSTLQNLYPLQLTQTNVACVYPFFNRFASVLGNCHVE